MFSKRGKFYVLFFSFFLLLITNSYYLLASDEFKTITRTDPMYPAPPYQYKNNQIVTIVFNTTAEVLKNLVPKPMVPLPSNIIFIYFGRLNVLHGSLTFSYLESGIAIPVMMEGKVGNYASVLYLDKALGIPPGREIYGFPKKDARMKFVRDGKSIIFKIERFDVPIVTATVKLKEQIKPDSGTPNLPWFNLKIIPSVVRGAPPEVKQITSAITKETQTSKMFNGEVKLKFQSSAFDKLGDIPITNIIAVRYSEGDFILDYGKIIYDYLTEKK